MEFVGNWWEIDPSVMPPEEEPVVLLPEGDVVLPVGVGCRDSLARPDTDPALAWVPTVLLVGSLLTTSKSAETLAKSLGDHAHVHMAWCSPLLHTDNVLGYIHEAVATAVPSIVICTGVLCFGPDGEPWIDFREGQPVLLKLLADVLHCTPSVEMVIINAPMSSPLVSRTFASRMKCSVGWPANLPGNDKPFMFVCDFLQNVILKTMDVQEAARHAVTSTRILKVCRPCLCINIDNLVPA